MAYCYGCGVVVGVVACFVWFVVGMSGIGGVVFWMNLVSKISKTDVAGSFCGEVV